VTGFCAAGTDSFFASLLHAHNPSNDDQEDVDVGGDAFASSFFGSRGADIDWGDGGGIAFEAMGVTLWPAKVD